MPVTFFSQCLQRRGPLAAAMRIKTTPSASRVHHGTLSQGHACDSESSSRIPNRPSAVILEFAGVRNVLTKRLGSRNMKNTAEATMQGLRSLKQIEEVARLRGKTVEEIQG
jgi:small subunit ribosomal protein S5